jgi:DNA-binding transcriptional MerR regulator
MMVWSSRERDFEGTASELAHQVSVVLDELGLTESELTPNERLVRHYVQQGILKRPERRGREAVFGFRQLVEFLVARRLIQDGWPLAKVAQFNQSAEMTQLLELLPDRRSQNKAQDLVSHFQRRAARSAPVPSPAASMDSSPKVLARSVKMTQDRISRREAIQTLSGTPDAIERSTLVRLNLTHWCQVYVDPEILRQHPPNTPELLGQALTQLLIDERHHKGEK